MKERLMIWLMTVGWVLRCGRAMGGIWEVWGRHLCLLFFSSCTLIISIFFIARQRANVIDVPFHRPFSQELRVQKCISQTLDDSPQRFYYIGQSRPHSSLHPRYDANYGIQELAGRRHKGSVILCE